MRKGRRNKKIVFIERTKNKLFQREVEFFFC